LEEPKETMRTLTTLFLAAGVVCATSGTARAQIRKGAVTAGAVVGAYEGETVIDPQPFFGFRMGGIVSRRVGLEAAADIIPQSDGSYYTAVGEALLYFSPEQKTVSFLDGGLGLGSSSRRGIGGANLCVVLGAGIKHFVSRSVDLRFALKDRLVLGYGAVGGALHLAAGVDFRL
jgi:hypothetical protein